MSIRTVLNRAYAVYRFSLVNITIMLISNDTMSRRRPDPSRRDTDISNVVLAVAL